MAELVLPRQDVLELGDTISLVDLPDRSVEPASSIACGEMTVSKNEMLMVLRDTGPRGKRSYRDGSMRPSEKIDARRKRSNRGEADTEASFRSAVRKGIQLRAIVRIQAEQKRPNAGRRTALEREKRISAGGGLAAAEPDL